MLRGGAKKKRFWEGKAARPLQSRKKNPQTKKRLGLRLKKSQTSLEGNSNYVVKQNFHSQTQGKKPEKPKGNGKGTSSKS